MDYENNFPLRLAILRENKGVSAREMSLAIGQNPGYINNIETGKVLPSMTGFFYICEYLDITPSDFFDNGFKYPEKLKPLVEDLKKLNNKQISCVAAIVSEILD